MAAFQPTSTLISTDGGAASHRWVQVRPDSAATGANFGGTISMSFKPGSDEYIDFSESYVSVRSTWDNNAGGNLVVGDNIAMSRWGFVNAFQTVNTYLNDVLVERSDFPAQSAITQYYLGKTSAWAETTGSSYVSSASFASRQNFVVDGFSKDVQMSPPQGVWNTNHLCRACPIRLELNVHPDWERRVAESTGASKAPGVDYNVTVNEVLLWVSVYKPEPGLAPPISSDILDVVQIRTQVTSQNAVTSTQLNFAVESSSYTLVTLFQQNTQGFDTLLPVTSTEDGDLRAIAVDWQGTRRPELPFNADFTTGQGTLRLYNEAYIASSVGDSSDAGALLSLDEWSSEPVFCQKLIGASGRFDDRVNVQTEHNSAFTGKIYSQSLYPARIVISYGVDGLAQSVMVAKTVAELASAAAVSS